MEKYCMFCGEPLHNGQCINSDCNRDEGLEQHDGRSSFEGRPISLRERRKRIHEARMQEDDRDHEFSTNYVEIDENYEIINREDIPFVGPEDETVRTVPEERPVVSRPVIEKRLDPIQIVPTQPPKESRPVSEQRQSPKKHMVPPEDIVDECDVPKEKYSKETDYFSDSILVRFPHFIVDYFREPGKVVAAAARKRDTGVGIFLIIINVFLSAMGTMFFGTAYLDDFFFRWVLCGIITPILAYGCSMLYGCLYALLSPAWKAQHTGVPRNRVTFRELFAVVTVSSVLPNSLLLFSCIFAPMDSSLRIFQIFALLITVAWIVCLMLSLLTVFGGGFSLGGLFLTVLFGFFAFLGMRAVWVWFLTGDFTFALHIPLSVFLMGY